MKYGILLLKIICGATILALAVFLGYYFGSYRQHRVLVEDLNQIRPLRNYGTEYALISPLLAYVVPSADQEAGLIALKEKISNLITAGKRDNSLSDASVYLSDLNRGRWVGINEQQKYNPASMLKVVIMVSYFKQAESLPDILKKKLLYTAAMDQALKKDTFNSLSVLQPGQWYLVEDLIKKMIIDSDNGAEMVLYENIDKKNLGAIYDALNITSPEKAEDAFTISPRTYSLFFRIIYSATYLDEEFSEQALNILSKTTFNDGIVAGLPLNAAVAQKFGQSIAASGNQIQSMELHDCGIVYYPGNPYFLCVMTKGRNEEQLKGVIKNISLLVYQAYGSYH